MNTSPQVEFETLSAGKGYKIGVVTLAREKALNALDYEMVKAIRQRLKRWRSSPKIAAVVIHGRGKSFCCGGDIRKLYNSVTAEGEEQYVDADQFFEMEYRSNLELQRYGKPLIAFGSGYVMGGGLGLFLTASHRIATPSSRFAWPEVNIGLFPDVLGTWYLSRIEPALGLWMGVTAASIGQQDAVQQGLAQYYAADDQLESLLQQLCAVSWTERWPDNHLLIRKLLFRNHLEHLPSQGDQATEWEIARDEIRAHTDRLLDDDFALPVSSDNPWVQGGLNAYHAGCPATVRVFMEQFKQGWRMSKAEATRFELGLAWQASRHPDLAEGIRALVVDKDKSPKWQHANPASVPDEWVKELMESPWSPAKHPLKDL